MIYYTINAFFLQYTQTTKTQIQNCTFSRFTICVYYYICISACIYLQNTDSLLQFTEKCSILYLPGTAYDKLSCWFKPETGANPVRARHREYHYAFLSGSTAAGSGMPLGNREGTGKWYEPGYLPGNQYGCSECLRPSGHVLIPHLL